jgi:uncharacterized membrane protein
VRRCDRRSPSWRPAGAAELPAFVPALAGRWYAVLPWLLTAALLVRTFGWRRALPLLAGGYLIAWLAEWGSTAGPGVPFGVYHYRPSGLRSDLRVLGVPLFDSLSFTWLAVAAFTALGKLGSRGVSRVLLTGTTMAAIDLVVDPVALRGGRWWLGSIYTYPPGSGAWYGVSLLNYVGWLAVGVAVALWIRVCLGDYPGSLRLPLTLSALLLLGVMLQSAVLAALLGVGPSALAALGALLAAGLLARRGAWPAPRPPDLLVACALDSEAGACRRALGGAWERDPAHGLVRWRRRGGGVEVWATGTGPDRARAAGTLAPPGARVLVAGVAGALDDSWATGSLAVASRLVAGGPAPMALDPTITSQLSALPQARQATIASVGTVADDPGERARLRSLGAEIVEMETAGWFSVRGLAVGGLRVVLDRPSEPLGPFADLVAEGRRGASPLRVMSLMGRRPGSLASLILLGRRQRMALAQLGTAVAQVVPRLAGGDGNRGWAVQSGAKPDR